MIFDDSWIVPGARARLNPCQAFGPIYIVDVVDVEHTFDDIGVTHVRVVLPSGREQVVDRHKLEPL